MSSPNPNKRKKAMIRLSKTFMEEVDLDIIEELIRASGEVHQDNESCADDCSVAILEFVSQYDLSELYDVIEEIFPNMSVWGRSFSFSILTQTPTEQTLKTFLRLLKNYSGKIPIYDFNVDSASVSKEAVNTLFPDVIRYTEEPSYSYSIYHYMLQCLRDNLLGSSDFAFHQDALLKQTVHLKNIAEEYQDLFDDFNAWDDPIYMDVRHTFGLYLDILGYFPPDQEIIRILNECLQLKDTKMQYFAALSLLRMEQEVLPAVFEAIASNGELRCFLYDHLNFLNALELFPDNYLSQEQFAESNMIQWLTYPTELGRMPDEIELMKIISDIDETKGEIEYYIYRFKSSHPNWKEFGWMAGVSGFYIKSDKPATEAYKYTFSHFTPWDSMTPEEHLESVIDTMTTYWDNNESD